LKTVTIPYTCGLEEGRSLPLGDILVNGEIRDGEYHEGWIGRLAMEVQVSTLLRDLLAVLGFTASVC
jgi:hypothetical protein